MTAALVRISPLALIAGPWAEIPGRVEVGGFRIDGAQPGDGDGTFKFVNVVVSGAQPTEYHTIGSESYSLNAATLTVTRAWNPPTLAAIKIILKRMLNERATVEWIACRGTKATDIETANTNGASAITNAGNISTAIAAYQAVVWP